MKKMVLLPLVIVGFASCADDPPVVEHHYHTRTVYVQPEQPSHRKAAASGGSDSAEGFRAVERPESYSQ